MIALSIKRLTAHPHRIAEQAVSALEPFRSIDAYAAYLARLHAFYSALEPMLFARLDRLVPDASHRRKLPLLERDLETLQAASGGPLEKVVVALPPITSDAFAMGVGYVLEGKTLGSRFLLEEAKTHLALDASSGAAFFAGYGKRTGEMWKAYTKTLTEYVATHGRRATVLAGARATFASFIATMMSEEPRRESESRRAVEHSAA